MSDFTEWLFPREGMKHGKQEVDEARGQAEAQDVFRAFQKDARDVEKGLGSVEEAYTGAQSVEAAAEPTQEGGNGYALRWKQGEEARHQERVRIHETYEAARGRRPVTEPPAATVEPFKVRIHFHASVDGRPDYCDMNVNVDWVVWIARLHQWLGIAWDDGYIPIGAIKAIIVHRPNVAPDLGGNVVPFTVKK